MRDPGSMSRAFLCATLLIVASAADAQTPPASFEHDVSVASMTSDRITWRDSLGHPRVIVLAHDNVGVLNACCGQVYGTAMREFRYQLTDGSTRVASVTTYGNGGYGGFGYVV